MRPTVINMKTSFIVLALLSTAYGIPSRKLSMSLQAIHPEWKTSDEDYGRIVGGQEVQNHTNFPYIVAVTLDETYFCGGTIVASNKILTAGHCTDNMSEAKIVAGSNDRNPLPQDPHQQTVYSTSIKVHDEYNLLTLANDIGMITLDQDTLDFNEYVEAIQLVQREVRVGEMMMASGWGYTSDNSATVSPKLFYVSDLPVIDDAACEDVYGSTLFWENTFCTNTTGKNGFCNGDSGGPLVNRDRQLAGVMSFVDSSGCESENPHGYTDVYYHSQWINDNINM